MANPAFTYLSSRTRKQSWDANCGCHVAVNLNADAPVLQPRFVPSHSEALPTRMAISSEHDVALLYLPVLFILLGSGVLLLLTNIVKVIISLSLPRRFLHCH